MPRQQLGARVSRALDLQDRICWATRARRMMSFRRVAPGHAAGRDPRPAYLLGRFGGSGISSRRSVWSSSTAEEFLQFGGSHGNPSSQAFGRNSAPPESLWGNIVRTAEVPDLLRKRLGTPISISNAYRNPDYNALIGGKPQSWHRSFHACDVQARKRRSARGGGRTYPDGRRGRLQGRDRPYRTFTHIDTRGFNARWNG